MKRTALAIAALAALAGCSSGPENAPKMIDVKGGSFLMGAPSGADAQQGQPQHQVTIKPFRLAETLVTFAQYDEFAKATGRPLPQDDGLGRGLNPVINIDRGDALAYIDWLNRTAGGGYRLSSEAEWEYAARAGTTTDFYWGDQPKPGMGNTRTNGGRDTFEYISPVKTFPANPWGFYDMAGDVWEMTADCLFADYVGAPVDGSPHVEPGCVLHMVRGGDYSSANRGQKPTARAGAGDRFRSGSLGFRVAQDIRAS